MKLREVVPAALAVLALIVFARLSPSFLDGAYLLSNATLYVEIGLLALGLTLVITTGNIDLSVASTVTLTACLTARALAGGMAIPTAVVFALGFGTLLGTINGLLVAYLRLPSFLVTLGTMALFRGAAQAIMGAASVKLPPDFKGLDRVGVAGIPWPVILLLLAGLAIGLLLHRTVFGRWITAVGTSEEAARYSGVPVERVKLVSFALTGFLAGIGALLLDSRLAVARHDLMRGGELDAIAIVVLGGTSILGGSGTVLGTLLAVLLMCILKTGMGVMGVSAEYQLTAVGGLLIVAALAMNWPMLRAARVK